MPKFDTPTPIAAVLDIPAGRVQRRAPHRRPPRRRRLRRRAQHLGCLGRRHLLRPHPQRPQEHRRHPDLDIHATTAYGNITARSL